MLAGGKATQTSGCQMEYQRECCTASCAAFLPRYSKLPLKKSYISKACEYMLDSGNVWLASCTACQLHQNLKT